MKRDGTAYDNPRMPSKLISDEVFTDLILIWPCLLIIICPLGLWANGLVIRTFLRIGLNDSVTICFFCLGLSDFAHVLFPLISIGMHVMEFMGAKFQFFFKVHGLLMFVHVSLVASIFNNLTMFITTFLALQRCLCIVKPLHFKDMFTKTKTWRIMAAFSVISTGSTVAYWASYGSREMINPRTNSSQYVLTTKPWYKEIDTFVGMPFYTVLPIASQFLVFGSVIVMSYGLQKSIKFRKDASRVNPSQKERAHVDNAGRSKDQDNNDGEERQNSKERTAIVQVALLCTIFLVTSLPKTVLALGVVCIPGFGIGLVYENVFRIIAGIRTSCDYLNSAVNFFIYYKYNSRFRKLCFDRKEPK